MHETSLGQVQIELLASESRMSLKLYPKPHSWHFQAPTQKPEPDPVPLFFPCSE
jgi:hypothetical protein